VAPTAGFYAMPKIALPPGKTDEDFVLALLRATGVLCVYGSGFNMPAADGFLRIVFLASWPERHSPVGRLKGRKLFITARDDRDGTGALRLPNIRAAFERAPEPKRLVVLDGSAHAQFLFETGQGERLLRDIEKFLSEP